MRSLILGQGYLTVMLPRAPWEMQRKGYWPAGAPSKLTIQVAPSTRSGGLRSCDLDLKISVAVAGRPASSNSMMWVRESRVVNRTTSPTPICAVAGSNSPPAMLRKTRSWIFTPGASVIVSAPISSFASRRRGDSSQAAMSGRTHKTKAPAHPRMGRASAARYGRKAYLPPPNDQT